MIPPREARVRKLVVRFGSKRCNGCNSGSIPSSAIACSTARGRKDPAAEYVF